jgi:hypothetical protein
MFAAKSLAMLSLWWLILGVNATAAEPDATPRLSGTFIQLLDEHGRWADSQWDSLFTTLKGLGIRDLIVQWSVLNGTAYYSSKTLRTVGNPPLETLLAGADRLGMKVYVGLVHDSGYWTEIERPGAAATYFTNLRNRSVKVAGELAPLVKKHASFQGWYIPEEVDDINWRTPESRRILLGHLSLLEKELRRLAPAATIAISTFSQAQTSPEAYQQFWDDLFKTTSVKMVLFQDGVGVNKLELDELPIYLRAIRAAADKNGSLVQVVVELFRQVSGPPLDDGAFHAVPGPVDRIRAQLAIAAEYATGGITGFSIPEYMTPIGGDAAGELLRQYQALIAPKNVGP